MGVHVHETDFAAEKRRRFRTPKGVLEAAVISDRLVHQSRSIWKQQVFPNEAQVMPRLVRCEQTRDDASRHRQERVAKACAHVGRMQQQLRFSAAGLEKSVSR